MLSGTTSVISGGSFFEGAVVGLIVHMCNRGMHGEKEPSRIDWNASGDEVYRGLSEWIEYLGEGGGFYLKKDESGKYYSIHDVFCNLPNEPNSTGIMNKTINKRFSMSKGDAYIEIALVRYSRNVTNNGSTRLQGMGVYSYVKTPTGLKGLRQKFINGSTCPLKRISGSVFTVNFYGESIYKPIETIRANQLNINQYVP